MQNGIAAASLLCVRTLGDLGAAIRARRHALGVSQDTFGEAVGLPWNQSTVSRYERGRIPRAAAFEVAWLLDLPADEVVAVIRAANPNLSTAKPPTLSERIDAVEDEMRKLRADVAELLRTPPPRPSGGRARREPKHEGS